MFNSMSLVAALLAAISMDAFREVPANARESTMVADTIPPMFMNSTMPVTVAQDTSLVNVYGMLSLLALSLNLLTLMTATLFSSTLALIPLNSVKRWV